MLDPKHALALARSEIKEHTEHKELKEKPGKGKRTGKGTFFGICICY